ncbi:hypothetical protein JCM33374_g3489 [Metschnikowia sp. JCM 33374]|nr:hypothetical protein JCM33374_g3489 [Metschnikowia sp. JCM 33374]
MKTSEEKIQFKNHFFKLGQGRIIPANDPRFWLVFWTMPRDASDIYDLLTPYDVQTVRDQNLPNMLVLVQVLIGKISGFVAGTVKKKTPHQEMLNCVRLLAKILPFIFELPNYTSEIEPNFFLACTLSPLDFSPTAAGSKLRSAAKPCSGSAHPSSNPADQTIHAATLVFSLVKLLFVDNFTVDLKHSRVSGSSLCLWEPGLGNPASYRPPDAIYDSHRSEVLKLLLVLVSASFYERAPNVVARGSVFMTLLVGAVDKQDFFSLVCSLTNLVCRSGRSYKGDSALDQDHPSLVQSRLLCSTLSSQLLASMLVYPMPSPLYTSFLAGNGLLETPKPINRVRAFFSRLTKDTDFVFLSSHLLGVVRSPMLPVESSAKQKTYRSLPSPMAPSVIVLFWELMHCNVNFRRVMLGRFAVKLAPCILYHMYAFYDIPQHAHSVKVAAYFLLYLSSQKSLVKSLIAAIPESSMETFPPEFRLPGPISTRDFLIIHSCQVLVALTATSATAKSASASASTSSSSYASEIQSFLLPTLVECLYNIIPYTNSAISGTDSTSKGLANLNPNGGLSYSACMSINQVLLLFSSTQFLTRNPGNPEMLALLLRALCAAATKSPTSSRMLLLSFIEEENMYNNIWNTVNGLDNQYFCTKTSKLLNFQEVEEPTGKVTSVPSSPKQPESSEQPNGNTKPSIVNNNSSDQLSIDSECSDDATGPTAPPPSANSGRKDSSDRKGSSSVENSIEELEAREIDEALRPKPPAGMSATAKEKLPRDTCINVSWGGNDALRTILVFFIPTLKEKLAGSWVNKKASVQDSYKIVKKIEASDMAQAIEKYHSHLHYDFFPETPVPVLSVSWNYLSLGWYISMLSRDIYGGAETVKMFMGANKSLVSNISSSLAMFGKFATSWSGMNSSKPVPERQDAAITDYLDINFSSLNVWATTSVKLFKIKRPGDDRVIQAFGMRFGSVGSASSVNDITNSLVKRFSDFRTSHRSSISSAGSVYSGMDDIPEGARLTKRDSVSSLHSLNTLNRARSNTPRNSMSN